jgi:hypothetical protein
MRQSEIVKHRGNDSIHIYEGRVNSTRTAGHNSVTAGSSNSTVDFSHRIHYIF